MNYDDVLDALGQSSGGADAVALYLRDGDESCHLAEYAALRAANYGPGPGANGLGWLVLHYYAERGQFAREQAQIQRGIDESRAARWRAEEEYRRSQRWTFAELRDVARMRRAL